MTVNQAARILRVTPRTVYKMVACGILKGHKRGGRWVVDSPPFREPTLTIAAVAQALQVSEQMIRRLCRDGRVGAVKIGRQWRMDFNEAARLVNIRGRV